MRGRILFGLIAAVAAPPALAQQATPTPAPAAPPTIITLPDTGTGTFSLAPRATPAPTPTPTPVATPTAAAAVPAPRSAAVVPVPSRSEARVAPAAPSPTPVASSAAEPVPVPALVRAPAPTITADATPQPVPAPASRQDPWLWALLGAGATALAGVALWLVLRRRRPAEAEAEAEEAEPVAAPVPPSPPPAAPRVAPPPVAPSGDPFDLGVQPLALQLGEREILLDIELLIANLAAGSADAVRVSAVMISANPDQDVQIAAFQANSQLVPGTEPFDLEPGAGGRMPIRLSLPREHVHLVTLSGRPMFVPLVLIGINWRGGLSVRRFGASFMVGTGGQGGKLGPIWLDRRAPRGLAATRYFRREAVAA